jgi:hypothetical protein
MLSFREFVLHKTSIQNHALGLHPRNRPDRPIARHPYSKAFFQPGGFKKDQGSIFKLSFPGNLIPGGSMAQVLGEWNTVLQIIGLRFSKEIQPSGMGAQIPALRQTNSC